MPDPDWFRPNYRDAQGRARRIVVGSSEAALTAYAQKHGKLIEQTHSIVRTITVRRIGAPNRRKSVSKFYGLMSA